MNIALEAIGQAKRYEARGQISAAWHVAAFSRSNRLPPHDTLFEDEKTSAQNEAELLGLLRSMEGKTIV
ncbi:MAG: hypothetical protein AAF479_05960 [Pseudomonadota bacterium]